MNDQHSRPNNAGKYFGRLLPQSFVAALLFALPAAASAAPRLVFSDLANAPKTGWEESATKGAAVSVWGSGFGSTRGTSFVTVNGAQLTSDSDYAEWGAADAYNARGLQRITFWLNNSCADGTGTIAVTVGGTASNAIPFQVAAGNIYFIAKTGADTNNGKFSTAQGGTNGPWLHFYMANPVKHGLNGGDVVYVRGGNYDDIDEQGWMLYIRGPYNQNGPYFSVAGYPAEWPILAQNITSVNGIAVNYGGQVVTNWSNYLTFSKLVSYADTGEFDMSAGHHWRFIGSTFRNAYKNLWAGLICGGASHDAFIYGNIFRDSGYDYYKHVIYFSAYWGNQYQTSTYNIDIGWNEVFNFVSNLGAAGTTGAGIFNFRNAQSPWLLYNVWIHHNFVHDCPTAAFLKLENQNDKVYVYNNVGYNLIKQGSGTAIALFGVGSWSASNNTYIYNNTFYDVGNASNPTYFIYLQSFAVAGSNTYTQNNIFYSINNEPFLVSGASNNTGKVYSDHDIFFGNTLTSQTGFSVTNQIASNPMLASLTTPDFHPQSGSPAVDAGLSTVSSVVADDFDGTARPQGAGFDIGAYEYCPAGSSCAASSVIVNVRAPSAPRGLRLQ